MGVFFLQFNFNKKSLLLQFFLKRGCCKSNYWNENKKYLSTDLMREVKIKGHFLSKDITLKGIKNVLR